MLAFPTNITPQRRNLEMQTASLLTERTLLYHIVPPERFRSQSYAVKSDTQTSRNMPMEGDNRPFVGCGQQSTSSLTAKKIPSKTDKGFPGNGVNRRRVDFITYRKGKPHELIFVKERRTLFISLGRGCSLLSQFFWIERYQQRHWRLSVVEIFHHGDDPLCNLDFRCNWISRMFPFSS